MCNKKTREVLEHSNEMITMLSNMLILGEEHTEESLARAVGITKEINSMKDNLGCNCLKSSIESSGEVVINHAIEKLAILETLAVNEQDGMSKALLILRVEITRDMINYLKNVSGKIVNHSHGDSMSVESVLDRIDSIVEEFSILEKAYEEGTKQRWSISMGKNMLKEYRIKIAGGK